MNALQLEFNIKNETEFEIKIGNMQKQIDDMHESMGKVRRKLFSQMSELQKLCVLLQNENIELKNTLRELTNEKTEWIYDGQEGRLFDVSKHQEAVC